MPWSAGMKNKEYQFSVHELIESPYDDLHIFLDTNFELEHQAEDYGLTNNGEIHFSGEISHTGTGVRVTGELRFTEFNTCSMCLEQLQIKHKEQIQEYFFFEPDPDNDEQDNEEQLLVDNETINLLPIITDTIVLSIDLFRKCKPDCQGLCVECGENLNDNPTHNHTEAGEAQTPKVGSNNPFGALLKQV
jgi:uncharacterized protein